MIEIRELGDADIKKVLARNNFAHLAMARDNVPYLVPIHYGYHDDLIYIFTTQGKKYEIISGNQRVCLQVDEVKDTRDWVSVIVDGEADELTREEDKERALRLITETNPSLTPAMSIRWMDGWIRENISVYYRIMPLLMSGRASVPGSEFRQSYTPTSTEGKVY